MSAAPAQPEARRTVTAQPWELGPPPVEPSGESTRLLGGLPFRGGAAAPSRRTAYRIRVLRRLVAAALAGVAVWAAVRVLAPAPSAGRVDAVVAARDLPAGAVLRSEDLGSVLRLPADLLREAPSDVSPLLGQTLAGPVTEGEVLTPSRLRGPGLLTGQPAGAVAVGLPLADAALGRSVRAGDSVSVYQAGGAQEVARGTVLGVQAGDASTLTGQGGSASVVLAVPSGGAGALAAAMGGPGAGFLLTLHR